jgi:signal transduction histidine kinase
MLIERIQRLGEQAERERLRSARTIEMTRNVLERVRQDRKTRPRLEQLREARGDRARRGGKPEARCRGGARSEAAAPNSQHGARADRPGAAGSAARHVERPSRAVDIFAAAFDALLEAAKLDAVPQATRCTPVAIGPLLRDIDDQLRPLAERKGLRLRTVASSAVVLSERRLLRSILQNVASNAVKYTASGTVLIGCRNRNDTVQLVVLDTGPGIPAERVDDAFTPFRRLTDAVDGAGLGLTLVRDYATLLAHRVDIANRSPHGLRVTLEMDRAPLTPDAEATAALTQV